MKALLVSLLVFLLVGCGSWPTDSRTGAPPYPRELVVKVETTGPFGGSGSAVILKPGMLLTARHVADIPGLVHGSDSLTPAGAPTDQTLDVAVLSSALTACPCVRLAASDANLDEVVTIVGWPLGTVNMVTRGESQGVHAIEGHGRRLIVATQVEGGHSGSGVFVFRDGSWQLVGIVSAGSRTQALVVPVSEIRQWIDGLN